MHALLLPITVACHYFLVPGARPVPLGQSLQAAGLPPSDVAPRRETTGEHPVPSTAPDARPGLWAFALALAASGTAAAAANAEPSVRRGLGKE